MRSFLEIFGLGSQRKSAKVARERLQIVVSHQREDESEDFLPKLRHELLTVISKYVKVDKNQIKVELQKTGSCSVLELNITLPPIVKSQVKKIKNKDAEKA